MVARTNRGNAQRFPLGCRDTHDQPQVSGECGKWIPFSESIPDDENDILITDGRIVSSALWQFDGLHFEAPHDDDEGFIEDVTHWMKYPDPPIPYDHHGTDSDDEGPSQLFTYCSCGQFQYNVSGIHHVKDNEDETITCDLCGKVELEHEAIEGGWIPSYWKGDEGVQNPVCSTCAKDRIREIDGEYVLIEV